MPGVRSPRRFGGMLVLVGALLAGAVVGCGDGGGQPPSEPAAPATEPASATEPEPAVASPAADSHCAHVTIDAATQECHEGPTPAGGAYSIGTFLDDDHRPVPRDEATQLSITEYTEDGEQLQSTIGVLGG